MSENPVKYNQAEIERILSALNLHRSSLLMSCEARELGLTRVLHVDTKQRQLLLSAPSEHSHLHNETVVLEGIVNDVDVRIPALHLQKRLQHDSAPAWQAPYPERIDYHQRRGAFRAKVSRHHACIPMRVSFATRTNASVRVHAVEGQLIDISLTGAKVMLPHKDALDLQEADIFDCKLMCLLPVEDESGRPLRLSFERVHLAYQEKQQHWILGCRFLNLDRQNNDRIARFIHQIQLHQICGKN